MAGGVMLRLLVLLLACPLLDAMKQGNRHNVKAVMSKVFAVIYMDRPKGHDLMCSGAIIGPQAILTTVDCAKFSTEDQYDLAILPGDATLDQAFYRVYHYELVGDELAVLYVTKPIPIHDFPDIPASTTQREIRTSTIVSIGECESSTPGDTCNKLGELAERGTTDVIGLPTNNNMCWMDWGAPVMNYFVQGQEAARLFLMYRGAGPKDRFVFGLPRDCPESSSNLFVNVTVHRDEIMEKLTCPKLVVTTDNANRAATGVVLSYCVDLPSTVTESNEIWLDLPDGWGTAGVELDYIEGVIAPASVRVEASRIRLAWDAPVVPLFASRTLHLSVKGATNPNHCSPGAHQLHFQGCANEGRDCRLTPFRSFSAPATAEAYHMRNGTARIMTDPNLVRCRFCTNSGQPYAAPTDCTRCNACQPWLTAQDGKKTYQCHYHGRDYFRTTEERCVDEMPKILS